MSKLNWLVCLDNGHGSDTPGKRSPDGTLREYAYAREIVAGIKKGLEEKGIKVYIDCPETTDTPLATRVSRINKKYTETKKKCIMVSVHCNAAPPSDGNWHSATGWSGFVSNNASENSKKLAESIFNEVKKEGLKTRQPSQSQKYWQANFYIIKKTNCPAILTENFFQDNKSDVKFLLSAEGKKKVIEYHVNGIYEFLKK